MGGAGGPPTPTNAGPGTFPSLLYPQAVYDDDLFLDHRPLWKVGVQVDGSIIGAPPDHLGPGEYFVNYDTGQFELGSDPAGHLLEIAAAPAGIEPGGAFNVEIRRVSLREFTGNALQTGPHWVIRHVNVSLAAGTGIRMRSGSVLNRSTVDDNGQYGVTGVGRGVRVTADVITRNNYHHWSTATGGPWDAGGTKFVLTTGLVVARSVVTRNIGNGIWMDIDNYASRVIGNRVAHNTQIGIDQEISFGRRSLATSSSETGRTASMSPRLQTTSSAGISCA